MNQKLKKMLGLAFGLALVVAGSASSVKADDATAAVDAATNQNFSSHQYYCYLTTHRGHYEGHSADQSKAIQRAQSNCEQFERPQECRRGRMDCR